MIETEILIIGGGIAGASTAYHLAQHGRQVTLLERGNIASEASGVNAGSIGAIGWGNMPNLESYLTMGSLEIFKAMQVELGYDIEFRRSGSLQAMQTEAEYAYFQHRVATLRSQGYTVDLLTSGEAPNHRAAHQSQASGLHVYASEGTGRPAEGDTSICCRGRGAWGAYPGRSRSQGDALARRCCLRGRDLTGRIRGWNRGHRRRRVVWHIGRLIGLRIPIIPVRGQMWASAPLPPRIFHTISAAESSLQWHYGSGK